MFEKQNFEHIFGIQCKRFSQLIFDVGTRIKTVKFVVSKYAYKVLMMIQ